MSIMAQFSIVPVGRGVSLSPIIADVMKIVAESGVSYKANAMGTVLEGDWDTVMAVIRRCHEAVMVTSDRAVTAISIDDRKGSELRLERKLTSVEEKLGRKLNR